VKRSNILITHAFTKKVLNRTVLFFFGATPGINYDEKVQKKTSVLKIKKIKEREDNQQLNTTSSIRNHVHCFTK
jgi:hypothetical protein